MAITFEPFKSTDEFTMENFNNKLGGGIEQINTALDSISSSGAKIAFGTYEGTGKYGQQNPNSLTFNFKPRFVLVSGVPVDNGYINPSPYGSDGWKNLFFWMSGFTKWRIASASGIADMHFSTSESENSFTLSWYSSGDDFAQLNMTKAAAGSVYSYIAIG